MLVLLCASVKSKSIMLLIIFDIRGIVLLKITLIIENTVDVFRLVIVK